MYVLYYAPDNASLIVRLALEELDQPYRTRLVDRRVREQDSPAYRAVNPTGLIPALETPAGILTETAAILLWLSETHGALAPAPGSAERGAFLRWLFFTSNTLHADLRLHFYPDRHAGTPAALPGFRAQTESRLLGHLRLLEEVARTQPVWLSPDRPSILTYYLATALRWLALYPADRRGWFDITRFPALAAIAAAMEIRPAARAAALAEGLGASIFTKPLPPDPPEGSPL
ncbi:MAG: glutathione S-transferase family protein [Albidovulum sp.]